MEAEKTTLEGLLIVKPVVYEDARGHFFESYNKKEFERLGIYANFVQDNQSLSQKGVLRGLHFQKAPFAQGKVVCVIKGAVLDVVVDIRPESKTYGKWQSFVLNDKNKKILWVPEGFAHGFLTLEDDTIFHYKCTNFYNKEYESGIIWNDPTIKVDWQLGKYKIQKPIISKKDQTLPTFEIMNKKMD